MKNQNASGAQSPAWRQAVAKNLLGWFRRQARDLPWRRTRDLYAIWVSEIMLQQTQVATVIPYWERFLSRFGNVSSLAAAEEREVLQLWEGLGYYRRARQLHAAARQIVAEHQGRFPTSIETVRSLPGIGRYTAGAILSIALDQRLPILEANTIRVLSRLTAYQGDVTLTAGQRYLWSLAEAILPTRECGAFNQALMELGSEVCTPRSPACDRCPVVKLCQSRLQNLVDRIPRPANRTNYEDVTEVTVVIRDGDAVLLRHCQPGERWAGLWDFPRFAAAPGNGDGSIEQQIKPRIHELVGLRIAVGSQLTTIKHGVTRFRITLHCYEAALQPSTRRAANGVTRWVSIGELKAFPLNVAGRKIAQLLAEPQTHPAKVRARSATTLRTSRAAAVRRRGSRHKSC
jgi:A/G-specific adenine glycosylase